MPEEKITTQEKPVQEQPAWGSPPFPSELRQQEIAKQLQLLEALRKVVEEGSVAAISIVVVRSNFVPEHAFSMVPYTSAILLAGMEMAKDDLKKNARRAMMSKSDVDEAS